MLLFFMYAQKLYHVCVLYIGHIVGTMLYYNCKEGDEPPV